MINILHEKSTIGIKSRFDELRQELTEDSTAVYARLI